MAEVPASEPELVERGFPQFSQLAAELRLKIWFHALPDQRIIEIEWCDKIKSWLCPKESSQKLPGVALARRESQEVFLKHYRPFLIQGPSSRGQGTCTHHEESGPRTYFDPTIDIVYIGANSENEYCFCPQALEALQDTASLAKIEALACELKEWIDGTEEYDTKPYAAYKFPHRFILVWGDVDYEMFEKSGSRKGGGRPAGELEFFELSPEEEASSRVEGLKELYEKEASKSTLKVPLLSLVRVSRGGKLMENSLGLAVPLPT